MMNFLTKEQLKKFVTPAISGIVIGLIIGLIVNTDWGVPKDSNKEGDVKITVNEKVEDNKDLIVVPTLAVVYNTTTDEKASIEVKDQDAGFAVKVSDVKVSLPTWVAVREVVGTSAGNILGAGLIRENSTNVNIDLLRATNADLQYQVYLYQDDGDLIFDFKRDLLIVKDRAPLSAGFITQ